MEASDQSQGAPQEPAPQTEEERQAAQDEAQPGDQGEQEQDAPSAPAALGQDTPVATSAPDPSSQSGTPLAEEREAGAPDGEGEEPPAE